MNEKIDLKIAYQLVGFTGPEKLQSRLREVGFCEGVEIFFQQRTSFRGPWIAEWSDGFSICRTALRHEEVQCLKLNKKI